MLKLIKIALKSDPPSPSNGNASVWPKTRGSPSARPRFRNYVGPDRILWESEFPRSTSTYPETARMIENNFAEVPVEDRDLILWRNAARLYKLAI